MGHARKRETACEAIHMRCVRCVRKRRNRKYETLHIQSGDLGDGIGSRDVKRYTKGRGGAEERGGGIVTLRHREPRMRAVLRRKQAPSYGVAVALQKPPLCKGRCRGTRRRDCYRKPSRTADAQCAAAEVNSVLRCSRGLAKASLV